MRSLLARPRLEDLGYTPDGVDNDDIMSLCGVRGRTIFNTPQLDPDDQPVKLESDDLVIEDVKNHSNNTTTAR
jgi:hypothetical protein